MLPIESFLCKRGPTRRALVLLFVSSAIWPTMTTAFAEPPATNLDPAPPAAKLLWSRSDIGIPEGRSVDGANTFTLRNENQATFLVTWDLRTGKQTRTHK